MIVVFPEIDGVVFLCKKGSAKSGKRFRLKVLSPVLVVISTV